MIRRYRHGGGGGGRSIEEGGVSEVDVEKYEGDNNNKVSTFAPWRTKFLLIRYLKCGFWLGMALWLHSILVYLSQMNDIRYPPLSSSATRRTIRQLEREHQIETLAKQRVVVSMATMPGREGVLLETLESLYHQSARPGRVQIHYSHKNKQELYPLAKMKDEVSLMQERYRPKKQSSSPNADEGSNSRYRPKKQSSSPNADEGSNSSNSDEDTNMKITFHLADPQWRSSAKLLGALYLEWNGTSPLHRQQQQQTLQTKEVDAETLLVVADDDVAYESVWLESLLVGHIVIDRHQPGVRVAIGMRGWRLQSSLQWGSPPIRKWGVTNYHGPWGAFSAGERYIIMGAKILQPYQVHVLTHVQGALYRPSFFEGTDIFHSPSDVHKSMDDIWISGHLAQANQSIARWVVPTVQNVPDGEVGRHLGTGQTVIDKVNKQRGVQSRASANNLVIQYFRNAWERKLFWVSNLKQGPRLRGLLPLRHWLSENIILLLYSLRNHMIG